MLKKITIDPCVQRQFRHQDVFRFMWCKKGAIQYAFCKDDAFILNFDLNPSQSDLSLSFCSLSFASFSLFHILEEKTCWWFCQVGRFFHCCFIFVIVVVVIFSFLIRFQIDKRNIRCCCWWFYFSTLMHHSRSFFIQFLLCGDIFLVYHSSMPTRIQVCSFKFCHFPNLIHSKSFRLFLFALFSEFVVIWPCLAS